jgi:maltose O-acetyltransferase
MGPNLVKNNYLTTALKACLRLIASHCPEPHLRVLFYRLSGIEIGKGSYINMHVTFEDEYLGNVIKIGQRVAVAKNVAFIASSHPNNSRLANYNTKRFGEILVEEDVWIGTGVVILPGVKIGKCSILGANTVVTKNVESFSIITGVPGKKTGDVRERFGVTEE